MFHKLKNKKSKIDKIDNTNEEPITKEDIENLIKLVKVAHETGCDFELCLMLSIGDFYIDAASYNDIKLVTSKKDEDKLLIKHQNMLLSNDTYIELKNIIHITFNLKYCDKKKEEE